MKYCKKCLMPDTRPGLTFNHAGICAACLWHEQKKVINWEAREKELKDKVAFARKQTRSQWDCVVGVSGGKDSTWQAMYLRDELKLNPLLVQYVSSDGTELGRQNINNLVKLGFSLISVQPNAKQAITLAKKSFYKFGNIAKFADTALFPIPFRVAMAYHIPIVFLGENPALEAGDNSKLGAGWDATYIKHNNTLGGSDMGIWLGDGIAEKDLIQYSFPVEEEFQLWGGMGIFMSYFLNWSGYRNGVYSIQNGLHVYDADIYDIGIPYKHNRLDSDFGGLVNSILKHIKLGFSNATEFLSYDIREGRVTRKEAIKLVKELDGKCHPRYVKEFCYWIGISEDEFWRVANSYRGKMWRKDSNDTWKLIDPIWEQESYDETINVRDIADRLDTVKLADKLTKLTVYDKNHSDIKMQFHNA